MSYQLIILKTATEDTDEAFNHYERLQPGLGDRFLAEVLKRFEEISKHPQYYGFIDQQHLIRDVIVYSVHCCYKHPDKRFR